MNLRNELNGLQRPLVTAENRGFTAHRMQHERNWPIVMYDHN